MNRSNHRKTAMILGTAAALVAAALILGQQRGSRAHTAATPATLHPSAPTPTSAPMDDCTGMPAPAQSSVAFEHGTLQAALSSHKLLERSTGEMFVAIDIAAKAMEMAQRPPLSLAIVIDRSGSMSGEKLVQAKRAAESFVGRLSARDRVAIVQYDDAAQVLVPSINMDAAGKARASAAIRNVTDGGGTNLHDGLALGRDQILSAPLSGALNRVLLLSDGQANAGIIDMPTLSSVASAAADRGVRITTVGLGVDYNEELMEALAEHGRGHYYYVQQAGDLQAIFRGELDSLQATVARNTELRLTPACADVEVLEVYGFTTRREGKDLLVPMADLFGGDERRIVARLRVPASARGARNVLRADLRYQDAAQGGQHTASVALGVDISGDAVAVDASANKDVIAEVMKVQSAMVLRQAADAYKRGDVAQATSINRSWRDKAMQQAASFDLDAEAVAPMLDELDVQAVGIQSYAPGSHAGKAMVKGSRAKAWKMAKKKR